MGPLSGACSCHARQAARGFTMVELLIVVFIIGIGAAVISLSMRDGTETRLEQEGVRLASLLESARAEARAAGVTVIWEPSGSGGAEGVNFRFLGLPPKLRLPQRWLTEGLQAEVWGGRGLVLGPEPMIGPQQVTLRLGSRTVTLATDGLGPFSVMPPVAQGGS